MDHETRTRFTQQLCHWATTYIAQGRSPFRKAEPGSTVHTSCGPQTPDIVFWINQDSFVAGGFLLLPDNEQHDLEAAQACAYALGVNYFAQWTMSSLSIWQADTLEKIHDWPLPAQNDSKAILKFEALLVQLMDEFRTLAVVGACPPEKLSFWHLTNLCLATQSKALPSLSEHLRRTRSQELKTLESAISVANDKLTMSTARLLSLLYFDQLPYNIQPENLDQALQNLVSALPREQFDGLQAHDDEPPLDERSAVLFHHLIRRLDQIAIFTSTQRSSNVIRQLLANSSPLPQSHDATAELPAALTLIHSNLLPHQGIQLIEADQPQRLALKHLLRHINNWPCGQQHCDQVFKITPPLDSTCLIAHLYNEQRPAVGHRNTWLAQIKAAWSGQPVELPRNAPQWSYELAYLLGIAPEDSTLHLTLPLASLQGETGHILFAVIRQRLTATNIRLVDANVVALQLTKDCRPDQLVEIAGQQPLQLKWQEVCRQGCGWLAVILQAGGVLHQLMVQHRLTFIPHDHEPSAPDNTIYLRSSLASQLVHYLTARRGTKKNDPFTLPPQPSAMVLEALSSLPLEGLSPTKQQTVIDFELNRLLGIEGEVLSADTTTQPIQNEQVDKKALEEKITHALSIKGVPDFPTHYLYDFFRPQTTSYPATQTPWHISSEFMGSFTLSSENEKTLEIGNEYLAHAICLASHVHPQAELPDDLAICQQIVTRYLNDLQQVYNLIARECHASLPTSTAANRLVSKIWKSLPLPPWSLVQEHLQRFQIPPENADEN